MIEHLQKEINVGDLVSCTGRQFCMSPSDRTHYEILKKGSLLIVLNLDLADEIITILTDERILNIKLYHGVGPTYSALEGRYNLHSKR